MLAPSGSMPAELADALPRAGSHAVWPQGAPLMFARDDAIYAEGDPARCWYRLLSGSVRVFRVLRDGRRHIGEFVFPGQFFGFEAGATHIHGAEAIEPAGVVAYSCERIEQRMAEEPAAREALRRLLMDQLAQAQERIMLLGGLNATGRLAAFLLAMAQRRTKANPLGLVADLPMSRVDVADYLGLTVETVSRLFTALRQRGAIRLPTANRVEILDAGMLAVASVGTIEADVELARCA